MSGSRSFKTNNQCLQSLVYFTGNWCRQAGKLVLTRPVSKNNQTLRSLDHLNIWTSQYETTALSSSLRVLHQVFFLFVFENVSVYLFWVKPSSWLILFLSLFLCFIISASLNKWCVNYLFTFSVTHLSRLIISDDESRLTGSCVHRVTDDGDLQMILFSLLLTTARSKQRVSFIVFISRPFIRSFNWTSSGQGSVLVSSPRAETVALNQINIFLHNLIRSSRSEKKKTPSWLDLWLCLYLVLGYNKVMKKTNLILNSVPSVFYDI